MLDLLVGFAIIGFVVWLLVTYIPMPKTVQGAIIVLAALWVLLRGLAWIGYRLP
jgi:hypothetical protein